MSKTLIIAPTHRMATGLARKLGFKGDDIIVSSFNTPDRIHGHRPSSLVIYDTDFARLPDDVADWLQPILIDMELRNMELEPYYYAYQRIFHASYWGRLWMAIKGDL